MDLLLLKPCLNMKFGDLLRTKRKEHGLTQSQLAEKAAVRGVNVTNGYISTLERDYDAHGTGKTTMPSIEIVEAIAHVLDWNIDEARLAAGYAPSVHYVNGFRIELPDDVEMVIPLSANINSQEDADEFREAFLIAYETVKARLAREKGSQT